MKKLLLFSIFLACLAFSTQVYALTISDIGAFDSVFETTGNLSGDAAELGWVNDVTSKNYSTLLKDEANMTNWEQVFDAESNVIGYAYDFGNTAPDYFLIKSGNWLPKTYLFTNEGNLRYGAFAISDIDYKDDIASVSHISIFGSIPVPEPATMMLLGFGLLGLAGVSRRKK